MENGIKRGDYVMLKPYMDRSKNPFVDKLYDDNYGRNGLVRKVILRSCRKENRSLL